MIAPRPVPTLLVILVAVAASGVGPVAAQEDQTTLTISVATPAGEPVGDAELTASWSGGSRSRTTAANGKAFISVPAGADIEVRVDHPDYVRNAPLQVRDASEREVSMTVYEEASARILVEDSDGPVPGAEVTFRKGGSEVAKTTTGEDGVVTSGTVESGSYSVRVFKAGYFVNRETISLSGDVQETVSIERGTVTLEVNVTDDNFDPPRPVGQATVDVAGSGSVTTQPTGIGRISVPVNAWASVTVTKDGYRSAEDQTFVSEEDVRVDLSIQRTPAISVELLSEQVVIGERVSLSVTDEYGDPVPGATVRVDGEAVAETDDAGQAVARVESAGEHEVVVQKGPLETAPRTVTGISADQATPERTEAGQPAESGNEAGPELPVDLPGFGAPTALLALGALALVAILRARGPR